MALRDYVGDLLDEIESAGEWKMSPWTVPYVVFGTFARGTKTYRAALLLADRGYGEQAGMLNRSLFEYAVVAWWLLLQHDEEEVMERIRAHREHARVLYDRHSVWHPELALDDEQDHGSATSDKKRAAELDKLFGYHGHKHWTGLTLADLVRQVEEGWDEPYGSLLWKFLRFVNTWNNWMLHHSAMGVIQGVEWADLNESLVLKVDPGPEWRQAALFASYWSYGMLVLGALRCGSNHRRPAMREFLDKRGRDFRELTQKERRGVGRNDPCPCGSGQKFKRCHGR